MKWLLVELTTRQLAFGTLGFYVFLALTSVIATLYFLRENSTKFLLIRMVITIFLIGLSVINRAYIAMATWGIFLASQIAELRKLMKNKIK